MFKKLISLNVFVCQPCIEKKGGGTSIYILKPLNFVKNNQNSLSKHIEYLAVEISNKTGKNINIIVEFNDHQMEICSFFY